MQDHQARACHAHNHALGRCQYFLYADFVLHDSRDLRQYESEYELLLEVGCPLFVADGVCLLLDQMKCFQLLNTIFYFVIGTIEKVSFHVQIVTTIFMYLSYAVSKMLLPSYYQHFLGALQELCTCRLHHHARGVRLYLRLL